MKTACIATLAIAAATSAFGQTTIYKHIDDSGRITYSNKPMKGATVMELEPLTTLPPVAAPATAASPLQKTAIHAASPAEKPVPRGAVAIVTPLPKLASIQPVPQRNEEEERRRSLEKDLAREEAALARARDALTQEQRNPALIAAVRAAQAAVDPSPSQLLEYRNAIDKASGRIRGLQATVADQEQAVESLRKELDALKP